MGARHERALHRSHQPPEILDGMKGERTVGEVEGLLRKRQRLEVRDSVFDRRIGGVGPRAGDHLLGNIQAENLGRPLLPRPAGEPAEAEAQVHNALRSEEHTSELQSLMRNSYAVLCLKKKNNINESTTQHK